MTTELLAVSVDCTDAGRVAEFWAGVLGRTVGPDASPMFAAVAPDDVVATGPLLLFHGVPEGKTVKNRLHLDLVTDQVEAESERLLALGARRIRDIEESGRLRWTTFADVEGNEFDLVAR
jgi:predicted enzyme related to lactoylglutathione lyase